MSDVTEEVCRTHEGPHGYISNKDDYLKRLRRIEGQARGLQGMVSDEKYCIDILTQISAMTSALQSVALGLLDDHLTHCVVDAAAAASTTQWVRWSSSRPRATDWSALVIAEIWVRMSMQYFSSDTIPCRPRACPSIRRRRFR